jgi:NADH-quinone oxidoreductase subunit N
VVALLSALSVVTMTLGNVLAISEEHQAHAGVLVHCAGGLVSHRRRRRVESNVTPQPRFGAVLSGRVCADEYCRFAVVIAVTNALGSTTCSALYGEPPLCWDWRLAMLAAMLSLGGVPPLAGFFAKLYVFAAAMGQRLTWLVVIGVLNSILSLYYYLMVVKYIFVDRSEGDEQPMEVAPALNFGLWVAVAGILILGVFAAPWYTLAAKAAGF